MRGDYLVFGQLTQADCVADLVFTLEGPAQHRPKKSKRSLAQLCRTVVGALSAHRGLRPHLRMAARRRRPRYRDTAKTRRRKQQIARLGEREGFMTPGLPEAAASTRTISRAFTSLRQNLAELVLSVGQIYER